MPESVGFLRKWIRQRDDTSAGCTCNAQAPYIRSHIVQDTKVMPAVMGIWSFDEWFVGLV